MKLRWTQSTKAEGHLFEFLKFHGQSIRKNISNASLGKVIITLH